MEKNLIDLAIEVLKSVKGRVLTPKGVWAEALRKEWNRDLTTGAPKHREPDALMPLAFRSALQSKRAVESGVEEMKNPMRFRIGADVRSDSGNGDGGDGDDMLNAIKGLSPRAFEEFCAALLEKAGAVAVRMTGHVNQPDGGVDINCQWKTNASIFNSFCIVQCKKWNKAKVPENAVAAFANKVAQPGVDIGIFITTFFFSKPAKETAKRGNIKLIDGNELVRLCHQHDFCVKKVVDEDSVKEFEIKEEELEEE